METVLLLCLISILSCLLTDLTESTRKHNTLRARLRKHGVYEETLKAAGAPAESSGPGTEMRK